MKRMLLLLPLTLAAAAGCVGVETWPWKQSVETGAPKPPSPPPPAVQPEEVNEANAAAKLEALRAEIDQAAQRPAQGAEAPKK